MLSSRQLNYTSTDSPPSPSVAISNPHTPFDLKAVSFLNRLGYDLTEPSPFLGMIAAGVLCRVTQLAALTRLTSSPVARLWTRGWGAQAAAGIAGFGMEGAGFPLATRLAMEASGHPQDWSGKALGETFISSYFFMGGLRVGGLSAGAIGSWIGAKTVFAKMLIRQGGLLGGIHLSHELERASGLVPSVTGSLPLTHSLAMLAQINGAGLLASQLLGPRFAAWERNAEQRLKLLQQGSPPSSDTNLPGQEFALAGGGRMASRIPFSRLEREQGPTKSLMSARAEPGGGPSYDQTGIKLLRKLNYLQIPPDAPVDPIIRSWIDNQSHPIAVAKHESRLKLPQIVMVNPHFETIFRWQEILIRRKSVGDLFEGASLTFSRIFSNLAAVVLGKPAEFDPTPLAPMMGTGDTLPCIGAGLYLKIGKVTYAFGIFTEIASQTSGGRPVAPPPIFNRPPPPLRASLFPPSTPPPPDPASSTTDFPKRGNLRQGMEHFRKAMQELEPSKPPPPDSEKSK